MSAGAWLFTAFLIWAWLAAVFARMGMDADSGVGEWVDALSHWSIGGRLLVSFLFAPAILMASLVFFCLGAYPLEEVREDIPKFLRWLWHG